MKKITFLSALFIAAAFALSFTSSDPVLENILEKLEAFYQSSPQEKLYLHLDKPVYRAGDNIWFKGYLTEAALHTPDSSSKLVYVELMDSAHYLIKREILYVTNGYVLGDFVLSDTLHEGSYLIRAYTNHMKNVGEDYFFNRQISIINARKRHSTTIKNSGKDKPDLQFFPEGGNLVACGRYNRIAFKATGSDGRGLTVSGNIVDEKNVVVATFNTVHEGLGSLNLKPEAGKKYTAQIIANEVRYTYPLPEVHEQGYVLHVDRAGSKLSVLVFSNSINTNETSIRVLIQSGGKVYHAERGVITKNGFVTLIARDELPDGISQLTIFDYTGRPVAERLVYEDRDEALKISVKTDSLHYAKRSQVTVDLQTAYLDNVVAPGNFSVTVYNEDQAKNPEQFPLTIGSYLSLTSDLKGHIENPGYYVKDTLLETRLHRDLLMMTHGWRRFTWNDVLTATDSIAVKFPYEHGILISGSVLKARAKKTPAAGLLKIMTMKGDVVTVQPDSAGYFTTDQFLYYDSMTLIFQTENEKGKQQPYKVQLDPFNPIPVNSFLVLGQSSIVSQTIAALDKPTFSSDVKVFEDVVVTARREPDPRLLGGPGDRVLDTKESNRGYSNVLQLMQGRLPGVIVTGNPPKISISIRQKRPTFLLNGFPIDIQAVSELSPEGLEKIEILQGASASRYGGSSVVNFIYNYAASSRPPAGISRVKYPGLYEAREFYSPRYHIPDPKHQEADNRTTLLWHPVVKTDTYGHAKLIFYTSDIPSVYRIVVEGITEDGSAGTATMTFNVR